MEEASDPVKKDLIEPASNPHSANPHSNSGWSKPYGVLFGGFPAPIQVEVTTCQPLSGMPFVSYVRSLGLEKPRNLFVCVALEELCH